MTKGEYNLNLDGVMLNIRGRQSLQVEKRLTESNDELKKACVDFEALFLQEVFKAMRKTIPEGGLFSRTIKDEIFEDLFYEAVSQEIAMRNEIGLAHRLYKNLSTFREEKAIQG